MRRCLLLLVCVAGCRPAAEPPAKYTIVAFGDSTTSPRGPVTIYERLLNVELPERGLDARVVNAGVPGNTTEQALARLEKDVLARKPNLVLVQFGINDSAVQVNADPPAKGSTVPLAKYKDNLREIVRAVRRDGGRVILMTPNSMRWTPKFLAFYGKPPYKPDDVQGFNVVLKDYAEAVRQLAREEKVPLVDAYAAFEAHGKEEVQSVDELLTDGMHPNDKGHRLVADLLHPAIAAALKD
jgi:lysophospholipase L1-like esterase